MSARGRGRIRGQAIEEGNGAAGDHGETVSNGVKFV